MLKYFRMMKKYGYKMKELCFLYENHCSFVGSSVPTFLNDKSNELGDLDVVVYNPLVYDVFMHTFRCKLKSSTTSLADYDSIT